MKIVDSEGEEYKAWYHAVEAYADNPGLTFEEVEIYMSGEVRKDVTEEVARRWQIEESFEAFGYGLDGNG